MKFHQPHHMDASLRELEANVVAVEDDGVALNRTVF